MISWTNKRHANPIPKELNAIVAQDTAKVKAKLEEVSKGTSRASFLCRLAQRTSMFASLRVMSDFPPKNISFHRRYRND